MTADPKRRSLFAQLPKTLALPAIPPSATRPAPPDIAGDWDDGLPPERALAARPDRALTATSGAWPVVVGDEREYVAITDEYAIVRPSARQHAVALAASRRRAAQSPGRRHPLRDLVWQAALLLATAGMALAALHTTAPPGAALFSAFQAHSAARAAPQAITALVPTFTQVDPTIGYDSAHQYATYWEAACSAAAAAEVLSAWGDAHALIGPIIDDLGNHLSPQNGLLGYDGFTAIGTKEHFDTRIIAGMSIQTLADLVGRQGIPVIIGVRADWNSYYGYFAGGHFLVVTGADAKGFQIVDSSMYYIHYLPLATLAALWDHEGDKAVIFTPAGYPVQTP